MKRKPICLALAPVLAGCASTPAILDSPRIPVYAALGAGAFYLYRDNWTLKETPAGQDRFRIELKKNILRQDGDSEASMLFRRRAREIAAEHGFDAFRVMEYTEGIESAALGAQRVAQGVIQVYRAAPAE
ncbi:MAG: hypothetical protein PHX38_07305 [Sulfuricella sp.]|nr:hypothetical protein [Sulfuricella sp.]